MEFDFLSDDFLLTSDLARRLYHEHAATQPIYDYHSHLPAQQLADDLVFSNITQAWLYGDHYKWRAMRTAGISEKFCTGDASDAEKFDAWAKTVPAAVANPLYVWTHLELRRYFGETRLLNPQTASDIYNSCSEKISSQAYSCRNLLKKMNVALVCTTDDPLDDLTAHKSIADSGFSTKVLPTWRPDKAMDCADIDRLNTWIDRLSEITDIDIHSFDSYIAALGLRHNYFNEAGCRISDHGLSRPHATEFTDKQIGDIFTKIRTHSPISPDEQEIFRSAMLYHLCSMNHAAGWTQQLHIGAIRNNNTKKFRSIGADTGFDSIGDDTFALTLAAMLDRLETADRLTKTIIYNLNPRDNELVATMAGNFQDGITPGKIQFGAAWWFLDQRNGMERHLEALSSLSLISRFVGMLTDSRSFLSFPRHEYFRRILCRFIAEKARLGEIPADTSLLGPIVEDICFNNAVNYFQIPL